ncbi:uncharacterized protein LOC121570268 [Coregonus clupeaformis]|uniref:uncharacterized protein LOC121570268 n=1 Tax=Coregonus clupeaformis TaxID=59861 RepID=UPI001E1C7F71|nr:uncharacterized protein LOC121570268 [Coregonus clupeaformis]
MEVGATHLTAALLETAGALFLLRPGGAPASAVSDPTLPFVVEVDASEVGVGAVLSQRQEGNFDVGDWELQVVRLSLEEWRHWLEGAKDPFLTLTDHRNLKYIQTDVDVDIHQALEREPAPATCPPERTYVPTGESLPGPAGGVGPLPSLGGVRPELTSSLLHQADSLPVHPGISARPGPVDPEPDQTPAVDEWFRRAEEVWNAAHVRLQRAVCRQKEQTDRHLNEAPLFHPGDLVWLSTRNLPLHLPWRKLSHGFVGPFKVLRRVNETGGSLSPEWCRPPRHLSASHGHRWDHRLCRQVPPGLPTSWGSAPVPGGLGGVQPRGVLLGLNGRHPGPQHCPGFPPPPSRPACSSPSGPSSWPASSCGWSRASGAGYCHVYSRSSA